MQNKIISAAALKAAIPTPQASQKERYAELCRAWLCACPGMYRDTIIALVRYFGSARAVYEAKESEFSIWKKLDSNQTRSWIRNLSAHRRGAPAEQMEQWLSDRGLHFVSRENPLFPEKLTFLTDCPMGLFYRGSLPDPSLPSAAVIGARRCSNYGQQMTCKISRALTGAGFQIISGMAVGIDGTAQAECLSLGGRSFGVLGCGADVCYPEEHEGLYFRLISGGGIISEYPPGTQPLRAHFPLRNRIISGLSDAVIVVEARKKSGSLITADIALEQGKDVYALPGRYNDLLSYGCNSLIEQGAGIIVSTDHLMANLAVSLNLEKILPAEDERSEAAAGAHKKGTAGRPRPLGISDDAEAVYNCLTFDAAGIEDLASRANLTLLQAMNALVELQLQDLAVEVSKNRYALRLVS